MATIKQKKAFNNVVENGGNVSRGMINADYSPATAKTPQKLTESKGWQELCEEHGLTDDFLVDALVDDIKNKPRNRKHELELGFKVRGRLKDKEDKPHVQNNYFILTDEQRERIARRIVSRRRGGEEPAD